VKRSGLSASPSLSAPERRTVGLRRLLDPPRLVEAALGFTLFTNANRTGLLEHPVTPDALPDETRRTAPADGGGDQVIHRHPTLHLRANPTEVGREHVGQHVLFLADHAMGLREIFHDYLPKRANVVFVPFDEPDTIHYSQNLSILNGQKRQKTLIYCKKSLYRLFSYATPRDTL
jgi:hypothetical protein